MYTNIAGLPQDIQNYIQAFEAIGLMIQKALPEVYGSKKEKALIPFQPCIVDPFRQPLRVVLQEIKTFLDKNPREIFTLFIESSIPIDRIGQEIEMSGLYQYAHVQMAGAQWPTLQEMITKGKRLVIFGHAYSRYSWILNYNNFISSTPYLFRSKDDLADQVGGVQVQPNGLLKVPNFLTIGLAGKPGAAREVNERSFLRKRLKSIGQASMHIINFVDVDFVDLPHGDVFDVVDELNGVGKYAGKPLLNIAQ